MSAERKVSYKVYMAWEFDEEEARLDEMSRQGWQVVKGDCGHTVFEKNASRVYRHRIDYNPGALKSKEEKERYLRTFAEMGWQCAGITFNGWIFWKKEENPALPEEEYKIYTDRQSLMEMFQRWRKVALFCQIVLVAIGVLYLVGGSVQALSESPSYWLIAAMGLFFLMFAGVIHSKMGEMKSKVEAEKACAGEEK